MGGEEAAASHHTLTRQRHGSRKTHPSLSRLMGFDDFGRFRALLLESAFKHACLMSLKAEAA
jgi:hypothetical protein